MNIIEELKWRGLVQEIIPGTEEYLLENKVSVYLGVDPTGNSMHIGNLVTVMMLVNLQRAGHKPYALVGGATGMVGDPSGKDKERQLLSIETIQQNVEGIRQQLSHFLDFEGDNAAVMVNNYDWFKDISFLDFLRDVGKHLTVNYMTSKESVKKRMSGEAGISYTEFAYQLLQGYDFYHLYQHHQVKMQVGGSDQWGNITTGTELIRRKSEGEAKAYAVVCPLLTREDGSKFGKTAEGKSVWLDPEKTSPYEFYQYWMHVSDEDIEKFIKIFTLKDRAEIEALVAEHQEAPHLRILHKALADDLTMRVHGQAGLDLALKLTEFLFSRKTTPESLAALSESEWQEVVRNSPDTLKLERDMMAEGLGILDLLTELGITSSKGEARRSVEKDKSVSINGQKVSSSEYSLNLETPFYGRYLQVQRGKKNRFLVEVI
ncbi:MAG: tyrosine--tRNA ligase [Bacteroidota bacterium]